MKIYKIQTPIMGEGDVLIYDKSGENTVILPMSGEIVNFMRGEYKKFVYGYVDSGFFHLIKEAPFQNW